jgi:hypothetical protein
MKKFDRFFGKIKFQEHLAIHQNADITEPSARLSVKQMIFYSLKIFFLIINVLRTGALLDLVTNYYGGHNDNNDNYWNNILQVVFNNFFNKRAIHIIRILNRKAQFEAELNAMSWLIKWEDVSTSMNSVDEKQNIPKEVI